MPTYTYACTACGEHLEVTQRFTDAPLAECPTCTGALRKVFHPVGVVFKGSGFYKTDSRGRAGAADGAAKPSSDAAAKTKDTAAASAGGEAAPSTPSSSPSSEKSRPAVAPSTEAAKA